MMPVRPTPRACASLALALAAILALGAGTAARAEEPQRRVITVTGTGETSARPDIAMIDTGVVSEAKTAAEALAQNTKAMNALFKTLEEMKIAKDDIQTSEFSVSPVYTNPPVRPDGTQEAPAIRGYQVSNAVSVRIRKLDTLGTALDKLVSTGSNRVSGISFGIDKPEPLLDEARGDAVKDAMRKAKLYAAAAGVTLGKIVSIDESGGYVPQPVYAMKAMAMRDAAPVPVAAGTQKLTANVSLVVELQ